MNCNPIFDAWLPKRLGVSAITLYPYILFAMQEDQVSKKLMRHELIHCAQIEKEGMIKFYLKYVFEYFKNRLKGMPHWKAYRSISYEVEAYENEDNEFYFEGV